MLFGYTKDLLSQEKNEELDYELIEEVKKSLDNLEKDSFNIILFLTGICKVLSIFLTKEEKEKEFKIANENCEKGILPKMNEIFKKFGIVFEPYKINEKREILFFEARNILGYSLSDVQKIEGIFKKVENKKENLQEEQNKKRKAD
nr:unnamed protein product [Meloidogyne enterolobii]